MTGLHLVICSTAWEPFISGPQDPKIHLSLKCRIGIHCEPMDIFVSAEPLVDTLIGLIFKKLIR